MSWSYSRLGRAKAKAKAGVCQGWRNENLDEHSKTVSLWSRGTECGFDLAYDSLMASLSLYFFVEHCLDSFFESFENSGFPLKTSKIKVFFDNRQGFEPVKVVFLGDLQFV